MIKRYMLYAYSKDKKIKLSDNGYHMSAASYGNDIFIYLETKHDENPFEVADKFLTGELSTFLNGKKYIEMTDIFHYSFPASEEYWERKQDNKKLVFKIARLKNDKVGEYVYYHYKLQREATAAYDKYGVIYLLGSTLAMYYELPEVPADLSLVTDKWDILAPGYSGNIIGDLSENLEDGTNGWHDCIEISKE